MAPSGPSGNDNKKLLTIAIAFVLIVLLGVLGYSRLLHVSLLDALYMTIITISTVGYKEIADMTPEAKLFSILIIFFGLTFVGYLFTSIVRPLCRRQCPGQDPAKEAEKPHGIFEQPLHHLRSR
jgi:heme O synthase-like polyprenyltransferase